MPETLLLVDDEEDIRRFLGISLADFGYIVHTAGTAEEAIQKLKEKKPSIVLSDIKMPGVDGIQLLQMIKAEDPEVEVIMITGHGDMGLAIESLRSQAADFITKPINDEILELSLRRIREKITMRRQLKEYTENLEKLVAEKSAHLVELERQIAAGQVAEGMASAMKNIVNSFEGGKSYFNDMPCFVAIHDHELKIVAANDLYKERLGVKEGARSWEVYVNKDACPVERTFQTGKAQQSKEMVKTLSGAEVMVIVYTSPIYSKAKEVELVMETSVDMTEVGRLQDELRATQQKYQELFNEGPCYITVQDKSFKILATNKRFEEDFGEGVGRLCYELYQHRKDPCKDCPLIKTFDGGESHQVETVVTAKSGEQYNILLTTAPIRDAGGKVIQVMEMSTNITQIRKLQDRLSSLGLMIASMSHGVKGMLTALDGGLYRLESGIARGDVGRIKDACDVMKQMVENIKRTVLDMLYYAKSRDLSWECIDVKEFAEEVASIVEPKARKSNVEFVREFDQSKGEFEVEVQRLSAAFVNLLENAVDACVEDKDKDSHKVVFSVSREAGRIIFKVEDNGIGMDKEIQEKIFTLFFSSKGSKGTGFGLFIANQIVEQHGGSIKVSSTKGKGTCFKISMPEVISDDMKKAAEAAQLSASNTSTPSLI
ncbi:MAG: response regulator [Pseudomonadota bacterium]